MLTDSIEDHNDCQAMCVSFCETNVHALKNKTKIEHKSVFLGRYLLFGMFGSLNGVCSQSFMRQKTAAK